MRLDRAGSPNRGVPQATVDGGAHFSGHVPIIIHTQMTVLGYGPSVFVRFSACVSWRVRLHALVGRALSALLFSSIYFDQRGVAQAQKNSQLCIRYLSIQNTGAVAEVSINPKETIFQPMFPLKFS